MIENCCICGSKVQTKKILPYRDLIGSGVELYNMHIARCDNCGFIFQQNPLTAEQLENRYKNESKYEFDSADNVFAESDDYGKRCHRQKHFIDENINSAGGGTQVFWKSARRPATISVSTKASGVWALSLPR